MRTKQEIENEIKYFEVRLIENTKRHNELNQIDCLGREGPDLRKGIARIEGKIDALKWVIL